MSDPVVESPLALVVYTDGGCKPSRGKGGYGYHGYLYTDETPKQGYGIKEVPTNKGYSDTATKDQGVTIEHYLDGLVSYPGITTNNVMELLAVCEALEFALENKCPSILIISDSQYVQKGLTEWVSGWQSNHWMKSDGTEVSNKDEWIRMLDSRSALEAAGVSVTIEWVKGHDGNLGNHMADELASRAVILAQKGIQDRIVKLAPGKGYWNIKPLHNRIISKSNWYFTTNSGGAVPLSDGRYAYHLGKHGDKDSLLGKRMSDASFSVVFLEKPDPVLESIREYQDELATQAGQRVLVGQIDVLHQPKHYQHILEHGTRFLSASKLPQLDLFDGNKVAFTKEMRPMRLAYRAIEELISLEDTLKSFLTDEAERPLPLAITEITDLFYEDQVLKGDKVKRKFTSTIDSSVKHIEVDNVAYDTGDYKGSVPLRLVMDMDLPSRNTLSGLTDRNPKVYVITWKESGIAFRYATVVVTDTDVGIWSAVYSNIRLLTKKEQR